MDNRISTMEHKSNAAATPLRPLEEKLAVGGLMLLIVYAVFRSLLTAAGRPFWFDEMCTLAVVKRPSAQAMYDGLRQAMDSNPPGFYLIERAAASLIPNAHIALRLPCTLGFAVVLLCVFAFVRKRSNGAIALLCSALLFLSMLYQPFAAEARPFGLEVACIALALICYQRAPALGWVFLLGCSLFLSETLHYYAIFAIVPFAAAEATFLVRNRNVRWTVWIALACSFLPLALFWPLLSNFRAYYGAHQWSPPSRAFLTAVYGWFFHVDAPAGIGIGVMCVAGVTGALALLKFGKAVSDCGTETPTEEYVLALVFLGLPLIEYVATKAAHGSLTERYALPALLGICMAASYLLRWLGRRGMAVFTLFLIGAVGYQERSFFAQHRGHLGKLTSPAEAVESLVSSAGYNNLPVVVSNGLEYLPITHYASPGWARRFVGLVDVPGSIAYAESDSVDKNLLILRTCLPLQVYEFSDFVMEHPQFLLYSGETGRFDWWPRRLVREGYSVRLVALNEGQKIYLVDASAVSQAAPEPSK
jgi:hypothetical protein